MKISTPRLIFLFMGTSSIALAAYFVWKALDNHLVFYFTPTQVAEGKNPSDRHFRIGGLVKKKSVQQHQHHISFVVTDTQHEISVIYDGTLPNLFREGKGVVVQGHFDPDHEFMATEVLAKHDENYRPPTTPPFSFTDP